ncbi:MAG: metalloregulator ArsR/SmtB family transcription factor [Rhodobacteraceae bacterium]|nr:metalloregulator ArsR/SmtB family transcription factor [Paracoccaceae bacterium]
MSYETALRALADPTRRAIVEMLRDAPQPVGVLADRFPISRPAVSQHLRVLTDAGLVEAEARGTRRVYRLSPDGLGGLREYLNTLWDDVLAAYAAEARRLADTPQRRSPFD